MTPGRVDGCLDACMCVVFFLAWRIHWSAHACTSVHASLLFVRRFNAGVKFLRPGNPEEDPSSNLPKAEVVWKWLDTAIATTKQMIENDNPDRQVLRACLPMPLSTTMESAKTKPLP